MSAADTGTGGLGTVVSWWWKWGQSLRSPSSFSTPEGRAPVVARIAPQIASAIRPRTETPRPVMGQPTPPRPSPILGEVERVLREARTQPRKTRKRLRRSARREQWQRWIAIGRAKLPKGIGKKAGAIIRKLPKVPSGIGGAIGPTIAWNVGYWIGGQIYERGTSWYYGEGKRPKVPPPPSKAPREHPHPAAPARTSPVPVARPPTPRSPPRPGVPSARPVAPSSSPQLTDIRVTAQRVPTPAPVTPAATAAAARSRTAQIGKVLGAAASVYALMPARARSRQTVGQPSLARLSAPLTSLQAQPLEYPGRAVPKVKTKTCECAKPRKRSGRKACRNPVVSKRKRSSGGRTLITTTRELRCQPSSRRKPQ